MRSSLLILLSITTVAIADVRLWIPDAGTDGNLGGRTGADNFCNTDANKPVVAGSTTRAFISVSAADEIQDMPTLYNIPTNETIYRVDGTTVVASNFAALLNTGTTLLTNNVGTDLAYTGSTGTGAVNNTCNGWTDNNAAVFGTNGASFSKDNTYLTNGPNYPCDNVIYLYCMTYTPLAASSAGTDITAW
ncbi:hypothetical protein D210916BOD24_31210 [Alteromonas sp. D210916BOD_24]|uniref:DUF1554 domain-containing protein n=1 Tax=Alteromonas sp. D210916BOD_24 TaxID=3157618 RepID=UPI00399CBA7C